MKSTILPIHPVTGLRALAMGKRGPIWPILGGNGEGDGSTGDGSTGDGTGQGDGSSDADGDLNDGGKKALDAERTARRAAEKRARDSETARAALEADVTNSQTRVTELESRARLADQYEAAVKAGLPLDLASRLNGSTPAELEADAKALAKKFVGTVSPNEGSTHGSKSNNDGVDRQFVKELFDAAKTQ